MVHGTGIIFVEDVDEEGFEDINGPYIGVMAIRNIICNVGVSEAFGDKGLYTNRKENYIFSFYISVFCLGQISCINVDFQSLPDSVFLMSNLDGMAFSENYILCLLVEIITHKKED